MTASEASEMLADIVAEMRYGAIPKHQTDHELLAIYADRIEAATKRDYEYPKAQSLDADKLTGKTISGLATDLRQIAKYHYARGNIVQGQFARVMADRIKEAWRRERAEVEANALSVGGVIGAMRNKREDRKAAVGELPHPTAGSGASPSVHEMVELYHNPPNAVNAAALRAAAVTAYDALDKLKSFSLQLGDVGRMREFSHLVCLAKNRLDAALSAPPRNCDLPEVAEWQPTGMAKQAWRVFKRSHKDSHLDAYGLLRCINWLLALATKKEGGAK